VGDGSQGGITWLGRILRDAGHKKTPFPLRELTELEGREIRVGERDLGAEMAVHETTIATLDRIELGSVGAAVIGFVPS